jgi:hypothetical protein
MEPPTSEQYPNVFTPEDLMFFEEHGYIVLHDAVPPENLQAAVAAIWGFLEMNPHDSNGLFSPLSFSLWFFFLH